MSNDLVHHKLQLPQTAAEIKTHINAIQAVMASSMVKDVHYGIIPGTKKPTLYKAGAEMLLTTFRIAVDPEIADLSSADEIRYRVRCHGVHMTTQTTVGTGVGEASTNEERYKWRRATGPREFEATPENRRRVKFGRDYGKETETLQVRTEPADLANTVLKMAKKRAEIDMCRTALACSDVFDQDIEDEPVAELAREHPKQGSRAPERQTQLDTEGCATDPQVRLIRRRLEAAGLAELAVCDKYGLENLEALAFKDVNTVLAFIQNGGME